MRGSPAAGLRTRAEDAPARAAPRGAIGAAALLVAVGLFLAACGGSGAPGAAADAMDTLLAGNGTRLFVHVEGSGEPIVVVHGGPVLDQGYLVGPLRPLGADHELVFYDQRLSGRSDGSVDSASVTLASFVADLEGIRRQLGLGRIHLLGHSWGGLLAMEYALAHPDRLRSLVLVSPMPPSAALWQEEQAAVAASLAPEDTAGMGELRASGAFRAGDPAAIEEMLRLSFRSELADPALASSLRFHIEPDYGERSRQFGYLLPELMTYDLTGRLPGLRVPALVVVGAAETAAARTADTLRTLLPDVRVVTIPGAGHFSFLERPEAFLGVARSFLEGPGEGRPGGR